MLYEYSHTKSESLAQIRTIMAEIHHFFLGDCFLLVHPVYHRPCIQCRQVESWHLTVYVSMPVRWTSHYRDIMPDSMKQQST